MSISDATEAKTGPQAAPARRARVAILGEFSAGKSTLINLITGGQTLRTQVTATQMPAIWMSHGRQAPYRVDLDGSETPIDFNDRSSISVSDTAYIRMFMQTPVLELCDLIDTPGNSDPNIPPIAWERIAEIADVAIWCSSSTQAWRQSEVAAWSEVPESLRENSILLLTRADKLTSETDREKVLKRVKREAGDMFGTVHMASLLNLESVQPAFRDMVGMCRRVNAAETPGLVDTAQILRTMHRDAMEAAPATTPQTYPEDELDAAFSGPFNDPEPARQSLEHGYATALWYQLTENLPDDDPDALDRAFGEFLGTLDREIATLQGNAAIQKAG